MADQKFQTYLKFRDEATGRFITATEDMIASVKKLGIAVKKEGTGVGVDLDKMSQSHDKAGRSARYHSRIIGELQGSIGSLRNMLLLYFFAMRPILRIIETTTTAAIAQEKAEMQLYAAFKATGKGSQEGVKSIIDYASSLQNLTGASDDQIISAGSVLATYRLSESQIKKLLPLIVDMTALVRSRGGEEIKLATAAKAVGQAFTSSASRLEYLGIKISDTAKKYKDFNGIVKALQESVGGAALEMAQTYEGRMKILKASFEDFNEQLGMVIIKSPVVLASMGMFSEVLFGITSDLTKGREETNSYMQAWLRFAAALIGIIGTIRILWREFWLGLQIVVVGFFEVLGQLGERLAKDAAVVERIAYAFHLDDIADKMRIVKENLRDWGNVSILTADSIADDASATAASINDMGQSIIDTYAELEKRSLGIAEMQGKLLGGIPHALKETGDDVGKTFDAMGTFVGEFVTSARDMMVNGLIKVIKGDFEGLKDVVMGFGDMLLKTLMQVMINIMMIKIGLGSFLGFGGGLAHTGGYMYAKDLVYGQPRRKFHSGGEVPATLLEGEYVLNQKAVRNVGIDNLDRLNRGESAGGGGVVNNYYIQAIDVKSFRDRLQEHGDIYVNASDRGIRDNTSLRKTTQRWG